MMKRLMLIGIVCCVAIGFCTGSEAADAEISRLQAEYESLCKTRDMNMAAEEHYAGKELADTAMKNGIIMSIGLTGLFTALGAMKSREDAFRLGCFGCAVSIIRGLHACINGTCRNVSDFTTEDTFEHKNYGIGLIAGAGIFVVADILLSGFYDIAFNQGRLSALSKS